MIGGLLPCSFIDFPGHLSAVIFTQGCNLRCRYCHNPQLCASAGEKTVSFEDVSEFLETRRGKLTGVVVSGGEPSLHDQLPRLLRIIRDLGFTAKLDTNGMMPDVVSALVIDGLVDRVAVDVKVAPGTSSKWLCGVEGQAELALDTLRAVIGAGVQCEARTTVAQELLNEASLSIVARRLAEVGVREWRLQPVKTTRVLDPSACLSPPDPRVLSEVAAFASSLDLEVVSQHER